MTIALARSIPAAKLVQPDAQGRVRPGTAAYRRISLAFFLAGYATFSLIYCVQPLLPLFAQEFAVSPSGSSLALSLTTGFLAAAILCAAPVSERWGRRGLMSGSMALAALLNIAVALVPGWHALLAVRAAEGVVLGGVPAVAMAYLAEEIDHRGLGRAMGLYVAGTAFGGMMGRVGTGLLTDWFGWQVALTGIGVLGVMGAAGFAALVPASRNFTPKPGFDARYHASAWFEHLRNPALPCLFAIGFVVMGTFVTVYNFVGFRLAQPPFGLAQAEIGLIFLVYLFGIVASSVAGGLADRLGRVSLLAIGLLVCAAGILLTLPDRPATVIPGIVVLTIGFFVTHSVASGWIGQLALRAKGHASSLYLLTYYLGSSFAGTAGGWFWHEGGWNSLVAFVLVLLASGLALTWRLRGLTHKAGVTTGP